MKSLVFTKKGLDNIIVTEVEQPKICSHNVLIRVKMASVNPVDYLVVTTRDVKPMPHIPGAEICGIIDRVGEHVEKVKIGDRVVIYNRIFDNRCDMCLSGREMLCRNGGIMSIVTNGGFAEYISVPEANAFKIPDEMSWEMAASLPVGALTPYHALIEAGLRTGEYAVIFGASGNTGLFGVQFAKQMGAKVIAVTQKGWVKDFGADHIVDHDNVLEKVREITNGKMVDVALDSLGAKTWEKSFSTLGIGGRYVTFGALTGGEVNLPISLLYTKQLRVIGSTGGSRKEFTEIIETCKDFRIKVWRTFKLEQGKKALESLFSKDRDGKILLQIN